MSFFKPRVSFSLNFASPFSAMTHNSYKIFWLKHYMLWTKRAYQSTIFRLLSTLMNVHPIPHAIFETTRSEFIQILHHCLVSWQITPLYFCSSNLVYFGQKEPIEKKFSDFWVVGWKFTKSLMSYLKPEASFSLTLHHSSVSWEITLLYFFSWNFIWFGQKEPIKVQNFRLSTAHVKCHQICTLIAPLFESI